MKDWLLGRTLTGIHLNRAAHESTSNKLQTQRLLSTKLSKNIHLVLSTKLRKKHDKANHSLSSVNKAEKKHDKANRSLSSLNKAEKKT